MLKTYQSLFNNKIVSPDIFWIDRLAEKEHINVSKLLQDAISKLVGNKRYV